MNVYLLEQREENVPQANDWLAVREKNQLDTLTFPKRRSEWRLGRWTAKVGVAVLQNIAVDPDLLASIEIYPAPSGAPQVFLGETPLEVAISISHRSGIAICAFAPGSVRLGCDLESIEPHSAGFVSDYFTPEEQNLIDSIASTDRWRLVAMLWSAKESALKAMQEGLRRDTRSVIVEPGNLSFGKHWTSLHVHSLEGDHFYGWWREAAGSVQTVIADTRFSLPICLRAPGSEADRNSSAQAV